MAQTDYSRAMNLLRRITPVRPVWVGSDGKFRIAHTGDMIEMLENCGVETVAK